MVQVTLDPEQRRSARRRAAQQGLTLSGYIARLVREDLARWVPAEGAPAIGLVSDAPHPPDHHGMYIGEAVAARMNKPPAGEERGRG